MSTQNENHLANLMCVNRNLFIELIKRIETLGYEVIITSSYRSPAKQKELFEKLKNEKSGRAGKKSKHTLRIAIDLNLKKGKTWWKKSTSKEEWIETGVPRLAKEHGFIWGGDFINNYDPIHFELKDHLATNQLAREFENLDDINVIHSIRCTIESFVNTYVKVD